MRTCACGCGTDLDALKMRRHARYASGACRARVSRYRADVQYPPLETAQKPHTAPPRANVKPSGLQVPAMKLLRVLEGRGLSEYEAREIVAAALPDAQRARWNGQA